MVLCFADHEYLSDDSESDNEVVIRRSNSAELDHTDTLVSVSPHVKHLSDVFKKYFSQYSKYKTYIQKLHLNVHHVIPTMDSPLSAI